jgi:hypothetical protein
MRGAWGIVAAFVAGGIVAGCRAPTEIDVAVTTDLPCSDVAATGVAVGELGTGLESASISTTSTTCTDGKLGTVVLVPSGDEGAAVAFKVVVARKATQSSVDACVANPTSKGCITARRALRFIANESLDVAVSMTTACEGTPCENDATCVDGVCRSATIVDPGQCAASTCGDNALPPPDGGAAEAGADSAAPDEGTDSTLPEAGADATIPDADATVDGAASEGGDAAEGGAVDGGPDAAPPLDGAVASCGARCALALGEKFTCVLADGGVVCWGQNVNWELGRGAQSANEVAGNVLVGADASLASAVGLVAGQDDSCAFLAGGGAACWGDQYVFGPQSADVSFAKQLPEMQPSALIAVGAYHACWAPSRDGGMVCADVGAGGDVRGPNAHDVEAGSGAPVPTGLGAPYAEMAASNVSTCALTTTGEVWCEGDNSADQADPDSGSSQPIPPTRVLVPTAGEVVADIAMMASTTCARTQGGHVFCWGSDYYGQRAYDPASGNLPFFNQVSFAGSPLIAAQLAGGGNEFVCALLGDGRVVCWGYNDKGELGRGGPAVNGGQSYVPMPVLDADGGVFGGAVSIAVGGEHACAFKQDRSLWCWGENLDRELGDGTQINRSNPVRASW